MQKKSLKNGADFSVLTRRYNFLVLSRESFPSLSLSYTDSMFFNLGLLRNTKAISVPNSHFSLNWVVLVLLEQGTLTRLAIYDLNNKADAAEK